MNIFKICCQNWRCGVNFFFECTLLLKHTNITHNWIFTWMGALLVKWHWTDIDLEPSTRVQKSVKNRIDENWNVLQNFSTHQFIHSGCPEELSIHCELMTSVCLEVMQGQVSFSSVFFKCLLSDYATLWLHSIAVQLLYGDITDSSKFVLSCTVHLPVCEAFRRSPVCDT